MKSRGGVSGRIGKTDSKKNLIQRTKTITLNAIDGNEKNCVGFKSKW